MDQLMCMATWKDFNIDSIRVDKTTKKMIESPRVHLIIAGLKGAWDIMCSPINY